jgi:hypothetical protein
VLPFGSIRRFSHPFLGLLTPWYDVEIISISDSHEHFGVANDRALAPQALTGGRVAAPVWHSPRCAL